MGQAYHTLFNDSHGNYKEKGTMSHKRDVLKKFWHICQQERFRYNSKTNGLKCSTEIKHGETKTLMFI